MARGARMGRNRGEVRDTDWGRSLGATQMDEYTFCELLLAPDLKVSLLSRIWTLMEFLLSSDGVVFLFVFS